MVKRLTRAAACAGIVALAWSGPLIAQDKPAQKPDETKIVIRDDTTPKVKKATKAVTDASITTAVKTRLMKDKVARGTSIDVDTKEGVVTISGTVPTEADKIRIGNLVRHTSGVKRVENNLTVSA
jgi:hyperosmotically inducible protein